MPGRVRSRSPSQQDEQELQNLSFVSHISNLGHGVSNVPVALQSIVAAGANAAHADGRDDGGGLAATNLAGIGSGTLTNAAANTDSSSGPFPTSNVVELSSGVGMFTSAHRPTSTPASVAFNDSHRSFTPHGSLPALSPSGSSNNGIADTHRTNPEAELAQQLKDITILGMAKKFLITGYPLTLSTLAQFSLNVVIISVVGKFVGLAQLGGASLALGLVNATGFAFGAGLCGALQTVLSHTYGKYRTVKQKAEREAQQRALMQQTQNGSFQSQAVTSEQTITLVPTTLYIYGTYAQRMAVILFIATFPLGVILCFADTLLKFAGEQPSAVYFTGVWCRYAVFGIPATMAYQLVQRYYSCQHITKPLSVAMITAALANPVLQIIFIKLLGFHGSPIGWLVLMTSIVGGLIGYMRYTGLYKLTWDGWDNKALKNLKSLTAIALPSMGVMLSEWVALEINALAAGFAPTNELAAFAITTQMFGIMWGVASGVIILTCVFVGNAVGSGQPMQARRIAFISIGVVFCVSCVVVVIFLILNPYLPYLFTNSHEVAHICQRLMYLVIPYHFFDAFQSCVMAIMRGCELQKLGAVLITFTFCVVGVPLSFVLFFYFKIGVKALWIGPFSAVACVGMPSYFYVLLRYIDWQNLKAHKEGEVQAPNNNEDTNVNGDDNNDNSNNVTANNHNDTLVDNKINTNNNKQVSSPSLTINNLAAEFANHNTASASSNPLHSSSVQASLERRQAKELMLMKKAVYEGDVESMGVNGEYSTSQQREGSAMNGAHDNYEDVRVDTRDEQIRDTNKNVKK